MHKRPRSRDTRHCVAQYYECKVAAMVKRCAWGTCNSDSRYRDKDYMKDVEFWPIPKPKTRLEETKIWVKACGRKHFTVHEVNKHSYVCSKHFVDGKPTVKHPYPIMAGLSKSSVLIGRKKPVKRELIYDANKKRGDHLQSFNNAEPEMMKVGVAAYIDVMTDDSDTTDHKQHLDLCEEQNISGIGDYHKDHAYCTQKEICSVSTQTDITMDHLVSFSDDNLKDVGSMKRKFVMSDVLKDSISCKFYTGVSLAVFYFILNFLRQKALSMVYWNSADTSARDDSETPRKGPRRTMNLTEELALTLLRLRRGFDCKTLGDMFAISESSVCRVFTTWLHLLSHDLGFLIRWPSKEQVLKNMPKCFKYFKKTRCIIDCTEFFIQKPSLPSAQRITYSSYKHHNTFKCLLGITPKGSFSFVSDLYTGSISDRKIVQESGFLDNVDFGDDIMADRGFLIRGDLALRGATLNIPPFAMGKQMCANATTKTRRIARSRIHVERAIGRLKNFTLLQRIIPLRMKQTYNHVVRVCAMLCNLDSQLVK